MEELDIRALLALPVFQGVFEQNMEELLGCSPGSASVLGLHNDSGNAVRLVMDRDVYTAPYFACHPCDNTQSLKFKTEDLLNVLLPKIGHEPIIVEL